MRHLADAARDTVQHALDLHARAEETGELGEEYVTCHKLIPKKDGLKAALVMVSSPERVRAAYDYLMHDETVEYEGEDSHADC